MGGLHRQALRFIIGINEVARLEVNPAASLLDLSFAFQGYRTTGSIWSCSATRSVGSVSLFTQYRGTPEGVGMRWRRTLR
jgi:hypothetical protein